jgi:hypothetical protein
MVAVKDSRFPTGAEVWVVVTAGEAVESGTTVVFCTAGGGGEVGPAFAFTPGREKFGVLDLSPPTPAVFVFVVGFTGVGNSTGEWLRCTFSGATPNPPSIDLLFSLRRGGVSSLASSLLFPFGLRRSERGGIVRPPLVLGVRFISSTPPAAMLCDSSGGGTANCDCCWGVSFRAGSMLPDGVCVGVGRVWVIVGFATCCCW